VTQLLMTKLFAFIFLLFALWDCSFPVSTSPIEELSEADYRLYDGFNIEPTGKLIYQFYHSYGFTDKVNHLISISKHDTLLVFEHQLPLDSAILTKIDRIYTEKFAEGYPIQFPQDYKMNADVTIEARQYHDTLYKLNVSHEHGTYQVRKDSNVQMIRIFDTELNLEYIEVKEI
jgi:hypothetical protein